MSPTTLIFRLWVSNHALAREVVGRTLPFIVSLSPSQGNVNERAAAPKMENTIQATGSGLEKSLNTRRSILGFQGNPLETTTN